MRTHFQPQLRSEIHQTDEFSAPVSTMNSANQQKLPSKFMSSQTRLEGGRGWGRIPR